MIFMLSLMGFALNAQEAEVAVPSVDAVSTHSISAQIVGLEYGYEQRLGGDFSMIFRAGLVPASNSFSHDYLGNQSMSFTSTLGVNIEPRYYTNFNRRARLGKTTYKNSADFVALKVGASIPGGLVCNVTPMYGIRRVWGKHWFGEFTSGINLNLTYWSAGFHLQYRIGFVF